MNKPTKNLLGMTLNALMDGGFTKHEVKAFAFLVTAPLAGIGDFSPGEIMRDALHGNRIETDAAAQNFAEKIEGVAAYLENSPLRDVTVRDLKNWIARIDEMARAVWAYAGA